MTYKKTFLVCAALLACSAAAQIGNVSDELDLATTSHVIGFCNNGCRFDRCKLDVKQKAVPSAKGGPVLLRAPKTAAGQFVCRGNTKLGNIKTGEAVVKVAKSDGSGTFVPISKYSPIGLNRSFKKNYFKLFQVRPGIQKVGRTRSRGNQEDFVDNLCVNLPLKKFEILKKDGSVKKTIKTSKRKDCVSFRTRAASLIFELSWDTVDDLDLSVTEPGGFRVSRFNPQSKCGLLLFDTGVALGSCATVPDKQETVRYLKKCAPTEGKYKVLILHTRNCNSGPTNYRLRIIVNGVLVSTKEGLSDKDGADEIATIPFTL